MHYLLQSNLSTPEAQAPYVAALESAKTTRPRLTWSYMKLIPFAGRIEPEADYGARVFPFGSASILMASRHYGWTPGVIFDDATFCFSAWCERWGRSYLVNHDAEITTFGQVRTATKVFMRPDADSKAFTGGLIDANKLLDWHFYLL